MKKIVVKPFWKIVNEVNAKWWNVQFGADCKFDGKMLLCRVAGSSIIIGKGCEFNSSRSSNLIGVYTPCMFSTLGSEAVIEVGDNCGFSGTVIGATLHVKLGDNVRCGANCLITDSDWHYNDSRAGENAEVIIEDNVWLGYGVKILKGVHIGENSLIGACSIVTKDIPANVIAAGNPCKVIKEI